MSDGPLSIQQVMPLRDAGMLADARRLASSGDEHAADKFESLLATQLVKEMRKSLENGFFGSGPGSDVFDGWMDEHLGEALSKSGALDLASSIRISLGDKQAARDAAKENVK